MNKKNKDVKDMISDLEYLDFINPSKIPSIDLYMDQVTTFMEEHLQGNRRNEEEKIMTKTMINNYTKNNLLPPPNKKRYSKEHLTLLVYIYYLKNLLSISDIQIFLQTMIDKYYGKTDNDLTIEEIYKHIYDTEKEHFEDITDNINHIHDLASSIYPEEEDPYLNKVALISILSLDVYMKKKFIENLIDDMKEEPVKDEKKSSDKNKSEKSKDLSEKEKAVIKAREAAKSQKKDS